MNIFRMAAALMALVLTASCLKVDIIRPTVEEGQVSLTIKCSDIAQTRATEAGEDAYNENKINRLDVFFYAAGASDDAAAIYRMTLTSLNATGSYTYDQRIETTVIETIFGTGSQCKVYAIANLPDGVAVSDNASVNALKDTAIETAALAGTVMQDNFVMDSTGDDVVTYNSATRGITGEIKLYRAASKIALFITEVSTVPVTDADGNVQKDAQGNDIMWTANTNDMMVRLNNGVKKTHLDNTVSPYTVVTDDYFSFTKGMDRKLVADGSQWKQELPFYSYSSDWSADGKDQEAYLTLIVPWQKSDAPGVYHNTYYQVPINGISEDLVRNNYYKISLKVSRLGTFTEGDLATITPGTYIILDWTTNTIDADMLDYRYLVVDQKEYTIYNQEELYIPFASSHETEITNIIFAQQNIKGTTASWTTIDSNNSNYLADLDIVGSQVYFKNLLDNVYTSSTFDFTPYRLTFRIKHTGTAGNTYYEDITVYQYPAIYGTPETNSDYNDDDQKENSEGFAFVNGYQNTQSAPSGTDFFGSLTELVGSPNRYVFTISSVEGTDYIIGDPRETTITYDENSANWKVAKVLENGVVSTTTRELKYYYGTDVSDSYTTTSTNAIYGSDAEAEAAERTINMVAPKFRVASGYAVLYTNGNGMNTLENLKKRCASYQEDGYPAGRWRLPTKAEFEFMISQVNKKTLPEIYVIDTQYWCAHGLGTPDANGNVDMEYVGRDTDGHSTRCVYDEWYWEDKLNDTQKRTFTWGDMPR